LIKTPKTLHSLSISQNLLQD